MFMIAVPPLASMHIQNRLNIEKVDMIAKENIGSYGEILDPMAANMLS